MFLKIVKYFLLYSLAEKLMFYSANGGLLDSYPEAVRTTLFIVVMAGSYFLLDKAEKEIAKLQKSDV